MAFPLGRCIHIRFIRMSPVHTFIHTRTPIRMATQARYTFILVTTAIITTTEMIMTATIAIEIMAATTVIGIMIAIGMAIIFATTTGAIRDRACGGSVSGLPGDGAAFRQARQKNRRA